MFIKTEKVKSHNKSAKQPLAFYYSFSQFSTKFSEIVDLVTWLAGLLNTIF
jgi:hypothetical protein